MIPTPELRAAELADMNSEANAFAMELLMPWAWVLADAEHVDICDERAVEKLARKYRVPVTVMAARLGQVMLSKSGAS